MSPLLSAVEIITIGARIHDGFSTVIAAIRANAVEADICHPCAYNGRHRRARTDQLAVGANLPGPKSPTVLDSRPCSAR